MTVTPFAENLFGQRRDDVGEDRLRALEETQAAQLMPVGVILPYAGTTAPAGWLLCDGTAIPAVHTDLIALVGANTPNLKGRVIVGRDPADTDWDTIGETRGAKTHALTGAETGVHNHTQVQHNHGYGAGGKYVGDEGGFTAGVESNAPVPGGTGVYQRVAGAAILVLNPQTPAINDGGSGTAHNNIQPSMVMSYIIRAAA